MARMQKPKAGQDGWTNWILPQRRYRLACCDCGLVHDVEWRVVAVTKRNRGYAVQRINPARCRVQFRVRRNNRSTGQVRRGMKPPTSAAKPTNSTLPDPVQVLRDLFEAGNLDDHFYHIRETEGKGWDGPRMIRWGLACEAAQRLMNADTCHPNQEK
jgi:hypothetical protein